MLARLAGHTAFTALVFAFLVQPNVTWMALFLVAYGYAHWYESKHGQ
jgi:hypothetical protein